MTTASELLEKCQWIEQGVIFREYSQKQMTDVHYFPWKFKKITITEDIIGGYSR